MVKGGQRDGNLTTLVKFPVPLANFGKIGEVGFYGKFRFRKNFRNSFEIL